MKFTATHLTTIVIVFFVLFFSYIGWNDWVLNQPETVAETEVEAILSDLLKEDSTVNIPIQYTYKPATFETQGDSTYWFVVLEEKRPDSRWGWYITTKCPGPYFDFMSMFEHSVSDNDSDPQLTYNRKHDYFIENFFQISEATYKSYEEFGKINN